MARALRIEYEGALYHILSRGNEQQDIFLVDDDRVAFMKALGEMAERFEVSIFAYVLMSNHLPSFASNQQGESFQMHAMVGDYLYPTF